MGMDEALVHNGDFANYHSICEYLQQRNLFPLFLTDTEVAVLLFDLLNRVYGYPLEQIIEALAPTAELDFDRLPLEKQKNYREIQAAHIHGSPDGPWFFIIARNDPYQKYFQLIGITDTAMLRPQVFALSEGQGQIGLICSEKQAIDATLHSLAGEDKRFHSVADRYWNARGGSHTDGGAFIFTVGESGNGQRRMTLTCTDKFGQAIKLPQGQMARDRADKAPLFAGGKSLKEEVARQFQRDAPLTFFQAFKEKVVEWDYPTFSWLCRELVQRALEGDRPRALAIETLTFFHDQRYDPGEKRRSSLIEILQDSLKKIFAAVPLLAVQSSSRFRQTNWTTRKDLRKPRDGEQILVLDAGNFPSEGEDCDARLIAEAYGMGWRRFIAYGYRGQRFCGCGLGPATEGVRIDVYGSSGDYLGSGIDGLEIFVHGNAQDQLGQVMKSGKMVIYGDVGQTFLYGAKGGEVYVLGNAAGRPLINAVGRPRVVINGTCLDYLAESFMAGDPHNGGGFVILNGMEFDEHGRLREHPTPFPGSNLFSLASGGAIYVRDPHGRLEKEQLNGGEFATLTDKDWKLILPYLKENERLFMISVERDLLTVDGQKQGPEKVYRKVKAVKLSVLASTEYGG